MMPRTDRLDVADTLRRVQVELDRRGTMVTGSAAPASAPERRVRLLSPLNPPALPDAPLYALADLLAFHDGGFIEQAYAAILKRGPDPAGAAHYLGALRSAMLSKVEILARLRYSPEGRARGVRIDGLLLPFAVQHVGRLPVIGYPVAWVVSLLRLPVMLRNLQRFEAHSTLLHLQAADAIQHGHDAAQAELAAHDSRARDASYEVLVRLEDTHASGMALLGRQLVDLASRLDAVDRSDDAASIAARLQQLSDRHAQREQQQADALQASRQTAAELGQRLDAIDRVDSADSLAHRLQQLAERGEQDRAALRVRLDMLVEQVQSRVGPAELADVSRQLSQALSTTLDLQQRVDALRDGPTKIERLERGLTSYRQSLLDTQRRTTLLLEEARKRMPEPMAPAQLERMVVEEDHLLDAFYATFEDAFRGTRDEIKQRAAYYLPLIAQARAGHVDAPVLDLGCGRGEWLELLRDQGYVARGIDLNRLMIAQCREIDLQVEEIDAIVHLRSLPSGSIGAITAMHLIEHLPMATLVTLYDEALRVLRPGGIVIFETPNPENVNVGSHTFYLDPTHRNPLPPQLSQFMAEARGFVDATIHRLSEHRGPQPELAVLDPSLPGAAQANAVFARVHALTAAAGDYAVVARKA